VSHGIRNKRVLSSLLRPGLEQKPIRKSTGQGYETYIEFLVTGSNIDSVGLQASGVLGRGMIDRILHGLGSEETRTRYGLTFKQGDLRLRHLRQDLDRRPTTGSVWNRPGSGRKTYRTGEYSRRRAHW
jgi:hypothetical protein